MIEFKNVSFTYDSVDRNAGIYNVNLKINDGEVIVFCGESGCGKTTISRLILYGNIRGRSYSKGL